jgi:hypothetical protein
MYSKAEILKGIEEFKKKIETDGRSFCEDLFQNSTVRLMTHKYLYYILNDQATDDTSYDYLEKEWYIIGRALGTLKEDETSPCVDFDYNHKLANEAIELANKWGYYRIKKKRGGK